MLARNEVEQRFEEHTLQELLASVLAEEGVVLDGTVEVVDHELEDRFDFLLGVASVGGKGGILLMISIYDMAGGMKHAYPFTTVKDETGEEHGSGGDMAWRVLDEAVVETADFEKVLAKSAGLDVVVVGLGNSAKEVHGVGVAQVVIESSKDEALSAENLLLGEAVVGDVTEVLDVRGQNLFVLGCDEHGSDTNQLETVELDDLG
jgi:hypothetical protein